MIGVHVAAQLDDFKFKLANSLLEAKLDLKLANPLLELAVAPRQFTDPSADFLGERLYKL